MKNKNYFDQSLLKIIVCPVTKEKLTFDKKNNELISKKAKLAFPMNHPAMPLTAKELTDLGVGYCHVAPPPPSVLLRSLRDRLNTIHGELGRS